MAANGVDARTVGWFRASEERAVMEPLRRPYDLDRLTDVALRVFAERGFDGSSMDDVARAAGITKAAIYHHARGKEALLERGLHRALEALFATLEEPGAARGRAIDRLRYIVRRVVEVAIAVLPELTVLVRVRGNAKVERDAIERRRDFDARVTAIVREAQAAGEFDPAFDPALLVRLTFGMCNSIVEWYRPTGKFHATEIADTVVRMLFDGCATQARGGRAAERRPR
jgi:AcrR family transcriptional regulator